jgi:uncharacterized membrane protein YraQ (UPF0718 family)
MKKEKKPTTMKENVGKLLRDVGKLTFGSFILGGVLRGEVPQHIVLIAGMAVSVICFVVGLTFITKEKHEKE